MPETLTVGSLFSGIQTGGLDVAAETLGFRVAWQVEADPWRRQVLAARWPGVPRHGNIKEVGARDLNPVDLLVAGLPCQPVSTAGRRRGTDDPRWLWGELGRLLRALRPRWCLLEQPPGVLAGGWFGHVLRLLATAGFDAEWGVLPAAAVGAPHLRRRVWILAHDRQGLEGSALAPQAAGEPGPDPAGSGPGSLVGRWPTPAAADGDRTSATWPRGNPTLAGAALWPTPKGSASHYGRPRDHDRGDLQAAVLWPTPVASSPSEHEDLGSWQARRARERAKGRNGTGTGTPLGVAARLWATPQARDGDGRAAQASRWGDPARHGGWNLDDQVRAHQPPATGALNPAWVEALQGYPDGWTDPTRQDVPHRLWPHQWPAPPDPPAGSPQHPWEPPRTVPARTVPARARRVSALGDSVVPQCAALALHLLWAELAETAGGAIREAGGAR